MPSSWPNGTCFQCEDTNSQNFRDGWRLHNGKFAQLCNRCASLYEGGRFCETFHSKDNEGWRRCEFCFRKLHCGCVASLYRFKHLDFGGVACIECWKANFKMPLKIRLPAKTKTENKEPRNLARVTSPEVKRAVKDSAIEPLFEKQLSITDIHNGRIILPKKCAEAYFPKITALHGLLVTILDTEGKEWEFQFRYWISSGHRTYILEAMKEFMDLNHWQPGDILTFHRIEPGENLAIGLKNKSSR